MGRQSLDFYLPDYNIAIECQGIQHFEPIDFFGGEEKFDEQIERDRIKYNLCKNNNINIIYYSNINYNNNVNNINEIYKLLCKKIIL